MIPVLVSYATPSVFESQRDRALLGLCANARRPVRFHGRVQQHTWMLRFALRALGEAIWSNDSWSSASAVLDPVVTVHPDRLFFEAFSQDQSTYVSLIVDPALFATEGEVHPGTTNVDFTAWLWGALGEMRSSRETWLRVEAAGFEVATAGHGGRFEQKVDLPDAWVRGFLQLQGGMAMPGTRLSVRPVDLLAAIRFLRYTKAKVSPRALRFEFEPGQDARLVLEPWEQVVPLQGATHTYAESHRIRTWGRRRLNLIEPLLPFAERVDIYLKGRALPSFYAVKLPGMTFVLGLTGWSGQKWTESGSFDLLSGLPTPDPALAAAALAWLRPRFTGTVDDAAQALACPRPAAAHALERLCYTGHALYDVETRTFRHRQLFETPLDEARLYPPDPRRVEAEGFAARQEVQVSTCQPQETRKVRRLKTPDGPVQREIVYRDWRAEGSVGAASAVVPVEVVVGDQERILFGKCGCEFFQEHLLNRGPCAHMLALFAATSSLRRDLPTSVAADGALIPPARQAVAAADGDGDGESAGTDDEVSADSDNDSAADDGGAEDRGS